MRYCLVALLLFAVLPPMNVLAAPAPAPFAILDIGPPRKGKTAEEYRQGQIHDMTLMHGGILGPVWLDPEVNKLESVARLKEARPWLAKNLEFTPIPGGNRLRLTFRAGTRAEQVVILNALLRVYMREHTSYRQWQEEILRKEEEGLVQLSKIIEANENPRQAECNRKGLKRLQADIPIRSAEVASLKQIAVIRWAK